MRRLTILLFLVCTFYASAQSLEQAMRARDAGDYGKELEVLTAYLGKDLRPYQRQAAATELTLCYDSAARKAKGVGDYDEARRLYTEALESPYLSEVHKCDLSINAAELYLRLSMPDTAMQLLEARTPSEGRQKRAWTMAMASVRHYRGEPEEAIRLYESIQNDDTLSEEEKVSILSNRAYAMMSIDHADKDDVVKSLKEAYDLSGNAVILSNLAVAESMAGRFGAALADIDTAIKTAAAGDALPMLRKRADILRRSGDTAASVTAWKAFFKEEKKLLEAAFGDPSATEQNKLDLWYTHRGLLSDAYSLRDNAPELLYDLTLFRSAVSLAGADGVIRSCTWTEVRKAMPKNSAAVEFVRYRDNGKEFYAALILTKSATPVFVPIIDSEVLNSYKIRGYTLHELLRMSKSSMMNAIYLDQSLPEMIWGPVLKVLSGKANHIFFSPDGIFHLMAIENLFPVDGFSLSRLSTTSTLVYPSRRISGKEKSLVSGGINYNRVDRNDRTEADHRAFKTFVARMPGSTFPYLKGTKSEVDSIGKILGVVPVDTLSEAIFKKTAKGFDIIHLATHGYSLDIDTPPAPSMHRDSLTADNTLLSSGITLMGANIAGVVKIPQDGLLSAREICEMDLSGVSLVVLSACSTGLGVADEGPAGLVRALKKAGVGTILATLWPVDDLAALKFMTSFYESGTSSLQESMDIARRELKNYSKTTRTIDVRHYRYSSTVTKPFSAPQYWAPFIIIDAL